MTQLTIKVENPDILDTLKRVIAAFEGVTISETKMRRKKCELDRALSDVRRGSVYGPFDSVSDLYKDLQS